MSSANIQNQAKLPKKTGLVFILRGLPSIGKTTLANTLRDSLQAETVILSADDFFNVEGKHVFDKTKVDEAHKDCFQRYKKAIKDKTPIIIIDNSNTKSYHYTHYLDYGQRRNYFVSIITIPHNDVSDRELSERSIHNIKLDVIKNIRKQFEWEIK